ncbi:flagellar protein FliT [Undibacterium sp. FT137W]|uniref:Flagellar protein FliT n=1 Tax=Undibacterium fentianense TaxID=2828728 RepID=A0A941IDU0_9BURK|nr:flagellar protein FliT [Undibacterium fentianense]
MNSQDVISIYETVAVISDQMLLAAKNADWDRLTELESQCSEHIASLREGEGPIKLTGETRDRKVKIIQKILADDRQIRDLTEPWMANLSKLIRSNQTERKLVQAYGSNQVA